MPVTYEILREERVVLLTYSTAFTMEEVIDINEFIQTDVLGNREEKVHTISDVSAVMQLPRNMLSSGRDLLKRADPRLGAMFVVTRPGIIRGFADIFCKLFSSGRIVIFGTVAEALEAADRLITLEVSQDKEKERLTAPVEI